jgi:hypothetical protein
LHCVSGRHSWYSYFYCVLSVPRIASGLCCQCLTARAIEIEKEKKKKKLHHSRLLDGQLFPLPLSHKSCKLWPVDGRQQINKMQNTRMHVKQNVKKNIIRSEDLCILKFPVSQSLMYMFSQSFWNNHVPRPRCDKIVTFNTLKEWGFFSAFILWNEIPCDKLTKTF